MLIHSLLNLLTNDVYVHGVEMSTPQRVWQQLQEVSHGPLTLAKHLKGIGTELNSEALNWYHTMVWLFIFCLFSGVCKGMCVELTC